MALLTVVVTTPTPSRINSMVKARPVAESGCTSPKPTVEMVISVM